MSLDTGQGFVRIIIGLFYQTQLFSLTLIQSTLHTAIENRRELNILVKKKRNHFKFIKRHALAVF
jgi:hypothetical protein